MPSKDLNTCQSTYQPIMHSGVRRRRLLPSDRVDGLYSSGGQQYYHLPFSVLIIIFASITLSTILINERNVSSFIEAVEPPSVPSTSKNRASTNLNIVSHNHNNDNNNEQHNIIDKEVKNTHFQVPFYLFPREKSHFRKSGDAHTHTDLVWPTNPATTHTYDNPME